MVNARRLNKVSARPDAYSSKRSASSKKLAGFGSATVLGVYRCPTCNCQHYGISEADAMNVVAITNSYLATLDSQEIAEWYGGSLITIERFTTCFFCGTSSQKFSALDRDVDSSSVSHQAVIVDTPPHCTNLMRT